MIKTIKKKIIITSDNNPLTFLYITTINKSHEGNAAMNFHFPHASTPSHAQVVYIIDGSKEKEGNRVESDACRLHKYCVRSFLLIMGTQLWL